MEILKIDRLGREAINMGCLQLFVSVAAQFIVTLIVGKNEKNVGPLRKGFGLEPYSS
jgi:hypothetical protein